MRIFRVISSARAGFTLIEMLVVIAVIAILAALLMMSLAGSKEKARRATCRSTLKQLLLANQLYANDNEGRLLSGQVFNAAGKEDQNHIVRISIGTWNAIVDYAGSKSMTMDENAVGGTDNRSALFRLIDCPNLYPCYTNRDDPAFPGVLLGFNYLGRRKVTSNWDPSWISPNSVTDDPTLAVWTDLNHWSEENEGGAATGGTALTGTWVAVPHRKNGGLRDPNSPYGSPGLYRPSGGKSSQEWGAQGGNVAALNGSVVWKKIGEMKTHLAKNGGGLKSCW